MATIRKREKKFQVQVRKTGHPPLTKTFSTRKEAECWGREMELKFDRNEQSPDVKLLENFTLGDLVERYRDTVTPKKRGWSQETYRLNAFLRHPICQKKLSHLSSADFACYRDERLKKIKPKSLHTEFSPLHNLFEVAKDEWEVPIPENPLDKVRVRYTDDRRQRRLKEGELERILFEASKKQNPFVVPVILFAIETAMRRGEILSLTWKEIDWERKTARVLEAKNGHSRVVPLTPRAFYILRQIRRASELDRKESSEAIPRSIFRLSANAFRLNWERSKKEAEVVDLRFHDLRHEAISRFFEMGLSVPEVALISGHRDPRMLLRYAHAQIKLIHEKFGA